MSLYREASPIHPLWRASLGPVGRGGGAPAFPRWVGRAGLPPTYFRDREGHRHGDADEEGGQQDLGEDGLAVALGTMEALHQQTVELAQLQPGALQPEAALPGQGRLSQVSLWLCRKGRWEGGREGEGPCLSFPFLLLPNARAPGGCALPPSTRRTPRFSAVKRQPLGSFKAELKGFGATRGSLPSPAPPPRLFPCYKPCRLPLSGSCGLSNKGE